MLGNQYARSMTEVLDECLNLATDNAKEEALGKLGISMETINAHVAMIMLGFDQASVQKPGKKSKMPISIPFTFLSQPVIKQLVEDPQQHEDPGDIRQPGQPGTQLLRDHVGCQEQHRGQDDRAKGC